MRRTIIFAVLIAMLGVSSGVAEKSVRTKQIIMVIETVNQTVTSRPYGFSGYGDFLVTIDADRARPDTAEGDTITWWLQQHIDTDLGQDYWTTLYRVADTAADTSFYPISFMFDAIDSDSTFYGHQIRVQAISGVGVGENANDTLWFSGSTFGARFSVTIKALRH